MLGYCRDPDDLLPICKKNYDLRPRFSEFDREKRYDPPRRKSYKTNVYPDLKSDESTEEEEDVTPVGNELWTRIKSEYLSQQEQKLKAFNKAKNLKNSVANPTCPEYDYLEKEIIPVFNNSLVKCLQKANGVGALGREKYKTDALDFITQYMYNNNPAFPERLKENKSLFDIELFRNLMMNNAELQRNVELESWSWTRDDAAVVIQKHIRGWLVRKQPDVEHLRMFWKQLRLCTDPEDVSVPDKLKEIYPEINLAADKRTTVVNQTVSEGKVTTLVGRSTVMEGKILKTIRRRNNKQEI